MTKSKSSYDIAKEGLTDLYNDTIAKAKEATDAQARKDLSTEAEVLFNKIRQVENEKKFHEPERSLIKRIFKR